MNSQILCHIVGLTPYSKKKLYEHIDSNKINILDLELFNKEILDQPEIIKYFKQYNSFKENKNDKYKDIMDKINTFWGKNMNNMIDKNISNEKKTIIIGYNTQLKNSGKKININTNNKFIIEVDKSDIRKIIEYNLDNHRNDIIKGIYPLENIDFDDIYKNRKKLEELYKKSGYIVKKFDDIIKILELCEKNTFKGEGLWISMKQPYNVKTKIYPKKNEKIFAFTEPIHAIMSTFKWNDDELKKVYEGNNIRIIPKKDNCFDKLKQKRFLYLVDMDTFIPHEKGNNIKYFSQAPVTILDKEEIKNVYDKFKSLELF